MEILPETKEKAVYSINLPRKWSELSYSGESRIPQGLDPLSGSWFTYFFRRNEKGLFTTLDGNTVSFEIQHPDNFNFDDSVLIVKGVLKHLTPKQRKIAEYWGDGPATKQWTPIIDRLLDTYGFSPVRAARVLAAVQAGINDAFVITWYFKYLWDVPRPNQLDQRLVTALCTPKFPSYPSGHSVISGTAEVILSYFFPPEAERLKELAEENSISRLYAGVHFIEDITEGLRLGRQIGRIIVEELMRQSDENQSGIDIPVTESRNADLMPPPYEQVIAYPSRVNDCDLPLLP
ncbi:MAG TPA: vanadium-dependent haloperoxidase [Bacillota bacterium]|nr:vanadium-dependent haloperoxidase [Bacillota bacterium]